MRTIAHISDLHFGQADPAAAEALVRALETLQPSLTIVSGDLTQWSRRKQFRQAREFIKRLPGNVLTMPGNHDIPSFDSTRRLLLPLMRYKHYINRTTSPTYIDKEIAVAGVNTATRWLVESGFVSRWSLRKAREFFRTCPKSRLRIVVVHHPFVKPPGVRAIRRVARPVVPTLHAFAGMGADIVLAGHFHIAHTLDLREEHPMLRRSMLQILAGTALCKKDEKSFNLLTIDGSWVTVEVYAWDGTKFQKQRTHAFRMSSEGWTSE